MPQTDHGGNAEPRPDDLAGGRRPALSRLVKVEPAEIPALLWSCAYFFCLLCGYYILRPLRDAMGAAGGVDNMKWLFLGSLAGTLIVSAIFGAITARYPRRRFIPYAYRFFIGNILIFFVLLKGLPETQVHLGRAFFVWVSVFNLFVVSVFWSFMADLFSNPQGKRLFGFIAVGGTLGQVAGSFFAGQFAEKMGSTNMLVVSAVLLEACCWCVYRLNALARRGGSPSGRETSAGDERGARSGSSVSGRDQEEPIGGGALAGLRHVFRSPYLLGICLFLFCHTLTATFLYITKLDIGARQTADQDLRVAFFARIDFWTGVLTVLCQVFLTSRLIGKFGVGVTLGVLPAVTLVGFAALGVSFVRPELVAVVWVLVVFEAVRRTGNFAFSRPAREVLYTVISREDKYKSKNVIDTFIYRSGDQIAVWTYAGLLQMQLAVAAIAFSAVPLAAGWLVVGLWLGRRQRSLAKGSEVMSDK